MFWHMHEPIFKISLNKLYNKQYLNMCVTANQELVDIWYSRGKGFDTIVSQTCISIPFMLIQYRQDILYPGAGLDTAERWDMYIPLILV